LGLLLAAFGLGMLIYTTIIMRRLRHQEIYMPVLEDWLWYGVCPLVAYSGLIVMATLLLSHPAPALFGIAGVMLLLLFNGLHNAWDIVTYIAVQRVETRSNDAAPSESAPNEDKRTD
ncbi:MAG TPA: hypothetical protein VID72_08810, partial [Ktedonobacterales bacterium]